LPEKSAYLCPGSKETAMASATASSKTANFVYPRAVKIWLMIGVFMVFMQVVIGGVTRLTGSGLSITEWDIVFGAVPPLNAAEWTVEFEKYKATPQYQKINEGMSMADFKFIYFWEFFHRLWARSMGFVFLLPFLFFYFKGWIDRPLLRRLGVVVLLAALAASFGWIMVASGLVNRPWVNAYKLTLHLSIALAVYSTLFWALLTTFTHYPQVFHSLLLKKWGLWIAILLGVQIVLGGIMSGMKAGLFYPTWPQMNGEWIPAVVLQASEWNSLNFIHYDRGPFMAALIQILHRSLAYVLTIIVLWYFYKAVTNAPKGPFRSALPLLPVMIFIQVLLGIFTLLYCKGTVPVGLGVFHQAGALVLLTIVLFLNYHLRLGVKK